MPRYKIIIEYNGVPYSGWQKQHGRISIQGEIEKAIQKFSGEEVTIYGSGRTDAGVHACAQVAHFDLNKNWSIHNVLNAINFHLRPNAIVITDCQEMDTNFHSRFSAKKRTYKYLILNRKFASPVHAERMWHVKFQLNLNAMQDAARLLLGTHDFSSFRSSMCQAISPIKTIDSIEFKHDVNFIQINVTARSFLHNMVRNIVGALVLVGREKWQIKDLQKFLEAKDNKMQKYTAPPYGLYLEKIIF